MALDLISRITSPKNKPSSSATLIVAQQSSPRKSARSITPTTLSYAPMMSTSEFSCPMLTGFSVEKDQHLRNRVAFLSNFAEVHSLRHCPNDDFCPHRTVDIVLHCLRHMAIPLPLFAHRVRIYRRSLQRLLKWVRSIRREREQLIAEVLKKWSLFEPSKSKPGESGVFGNSLSFGTGNNARAYYFDGSVGTTRREAVQFLYDQKRSEFRRKYREYQVVVRDQAAELARCTKLLREGSFKEVFEEVQLREKVSSLTKELRQLKLDRPRFSVKPSDFSVQELQNALYVLTINPEASLLMLNSSVQLNGSCLLNSSFVGRANSSFVEADLNQSLPSLSVSALHLSVPIPRSPGGGASSQVNLSHPKSFKGLPKSPRSPTSPIGSGRSKSSFPSIGDTVSSARSVRSNDGNSSGPLTAGSSSSSGRKSVNCSSNSSSPRKFSRNSDVSSDGAPNSTRLPTTATAANYSGSPRIPSHSSGIYEPLPTIPSSPKAKR